MCSERGTAGVTRTAKSVLLVVAAVVLLGACSRSTTSRVSSEPRSGDGGTGRAVQADSTDATQACQKVVEKGQSLRAAFESSGRAIGKWQMERNGPSGPNGESGFARKHAIDAVVYVCYVDGAIATPIPPGLPGHDRARFLVAADGSYDLD